jgi:hypothetical protein
VLYFSLLFLQQQSLRPFFGAIASCCLSFTFWVVAAFLIESTSDPRSLATERQQKSVLRGRTKKSLQLLDFFGRANIAKDTKSWLLRQGKQ